MMKKIIIGISLAIIIIVCTALLLNVKKGKTTNKALSVKMAHNIIDDGTAERKISIILYFTEENQFNTNNVLERVYIADEKGNFKMALDIVEIIKTNCKYSIDKVEYEAYKYDLLIPSNKNSYFLEKAYIELVAKGKILKCDIGTFNVIYYPELGEEKEITISMLEGYNVENPFTTVGAIHMKIENKTNSLINIQKIVIDEDILIDNSKINQSIDYENYQIEGEYCDNELNLPIYSYGEIELELPLKYLNLKLLKESTIQVYYEYKGNNDCYILDCYNFFDNNFSIPLLKDVINIYEYD